MCTSARIHQHIDQLNHGEVFTTRDMLTYGRRGAVDQTLYRAVKYGLIIRLARGVFIKNSIGQRIVSVAEVARVKTAAFGKELMTHAHDCAIKLGLIAGPNEEVMFNVSGHSSSFLCGDVRVHLHGVSRRKFVLGDAPHGTQMRSFWYMKRAGHLSTDYRSVVSRLNRTERLKLQKKARWIPAWLSDLICH